MNPLINILIRTSGRPMHFSRCITSLMRQTYENIRVIVSADNGLSFQYANLPFVSLIRVTPSRVPFFYNLYCNDLKREVRDGWFFFLDDDDHLDNPTVLEEISQHLTDPDTAVICQFRRKDKPKPSDELMEAGQIVRGKIGLPCIFLHHSKKHIADVAASESGDWAFIQSVAYQIKTKFVRQVVVNSPRRNYGETYL